MKSLTRAAESEAPTPFLHQFLVTASATPLRSFLLLARTKRFSMSFLRRLIARVMPARALRSEFQIAELASQQLLRMLVGPINLYSFNFRAIPLTPEIQEMLGFLASSTDVLAQHLGGAPSGAGSINATLRVYQELFDDKHTEVLVESTFELFDTPTEQFEIGRRLGISFASALLRQDADIPAGITVHLFSERYRSYCGNPLGLDK